ncbi:MAG: hypothetical protein KAX38_10085, partial [Candidatus Krumholzibacteria bacterium]|nr:hypothetical protein [Candidatus Krumholzibacteria bacterium]
MNATRNNSTITLIIVLLAISISGCYTLLRHPPAADLPEKMNFNRCYECHTAYHHPGPFDPFYSDPWWDYYTLPWWYDDIIVITDEGEVPGKRLIHERNVKYHDGGLGIGPPAIVQTPPMVRDTKDENPKEEAEEKVKKRVLHDGRRRPRDGYKREQGKRRVSEKKTEKKRVDSKSKKVKDYSEDGTEKAKSTEKKRKP